MTAFGDFEPAGDSQDGYVYPAYDDRCFARVPGTAGDVLGVDVGPSLPAAAVPDGSFEQVVVVVLDGVGLDRFEACAGSVGLLEPAATAGRVTPLTSVYPSETAAAITTVHTGRTPAEHGLLGWNVRLPSADLTCHSLPFATREADYGASVDLSEAAEVTGRDLFDGTPVHEQFQAAGVASHVIEPSRIGGSYNEVVERGAIQHEADSVASFAVTLREQLAAAQQPSYFYCYWPEIDGVSHDEGTQSAIYGAELAAVCTALERQLAAVGPATAAETLVVVTADHGHHDADPAEAVDLSELPGVWDRLATHDDGRRVLPTGGPRNLHLHVADGQREAVRRAITDAPFEARVTTGAAAIDDGLFGPGEVSPKLRERVGDLLVVPETANVWFSDEGRKLEFVGTHGGQHPREMAVPFVAASLADLQAEL